MRIAVPVLFAMISLSAAPAEKKEVLTEDDKKLLTQILKDFLVDPQGCDYVRVEVPTYSAWGGEGKRKRDGWLVKKRGGDRIAFTDGYQIPAPAQFEKLDFPAACQELYADKPAPKPGDGLDREERSRRMRETADGIGGSGDLMNAAWLHRLGQDDLAAHALAAARATAKTDRRGEPFKPAEIDSATRENLRSELAWEAYAGLVHAFVNRGDEEALAHGERLLKLYPELVEKGKEYAQAKPLVADLVRRKAGGTFGTPAADKLPAGLAKNPTKAVTWLVAALDEVDARQQGQPGGVELGADWRVKALITLGEPAVPALIDAVEKDERFTRSVHFWRDFARHRTVLSAREPALVALMSILRVRVFEPVSTGDNFTARGDDAAKETAEVLRKYWAAYGKFPFDERMMKILTDPKSSDRACREAASNLATLGSDETIGSTVWSGSVGRDPAKPNPAVKKFDKPTAAEAVVAAMDRELARVAKNPGRDADSSRASALSGYLSALAGLGDTRVATELARRAEAVPDLGGRWRYALAAFECGAKEPILSLAAEVRKGTLKLPGETPGDGAAIDALENLVDLFTALSLPETGAAVRALGDPEHPYRATVVQGILNGNERGFDGTPFHRHSFCVTVLRQLLDDESASGFHYAIEKGMVMERSPGGSGGHSLPDRGPLADPKLRKEKVAGRVCDRAMILVSNLVAGVPDYHPLSADAADRLKQAKAVIDRFPSGFRRANRAESEKIAGSFSFSPLYIPDARPLEKPATPEDVTAGRAVFHLDGKGKVADQKVPAWVVRKADAQLKSPPYGWLIQAEVGPDGMIVYGVVFRHEIRRLGSTEVDKILPFSKP